MVTKPVSIDDLLAQPIPIASASSSTSSVSLAVSAAATSTAAMASSSSAMLSVSVSAAASIAPASAPAAAPAPLPLPEVAPVALAPLPAPEAAPAPVVEPAPAPVPEEPLDEKVLAVLRTLTTRGGKEFNVETDLAIYRFMASATGARTNWSAYAANNPIMVSGGFNSEEVRSRARIIGKALAKAKVEPAPQAPE